LIFCVLWQRIWNYACSRYKAAIEEAVHLQSEIIFQQLAPFPASLWAELICEHKSYSLHSKRSESCWQRFLAVGLITASMLLSDWLCGRFQPVALLNQLFTVSMH
jgi:hypothetical protein